MLNRPTRTINFSETSLENIFKNASNKNVKETELLDSHIAGHLVPVVLVETNTLVTESKKPKKKTGKSTAKIQLLKHTLSEVDWTPSYT